MKVETIEKIEKLLNEKREPIIEIDGRKYVIDRLTNKLTPIFDNYVKPIQLHTLTGLINYIVTNPDNLDYKNLIIHIESPSKVRLFSNMHSSFDERSIYIDVCLNELELKLNRAMSVEDFIIMINSMFVQNEDSKYLTSITSKIIDFNEKTLSDDGIQQNVIIKSGVSLKEEGQTKAIVKLAPYRTFIEVEQPESEFLFRSVKHSNNGIQFALFEADGGKWKSIAMLNIRNWIKLKLSENIYSSIKILS